MAKSTLDVSKQSIRGGLALIHETLRLVKEEFRPHAAFNDVARISSFHRIQCSPGIRDAANYIHSYLSSEGIRAEIMSVPAKRGVKWWSQESFPEWVARGAELILLEDGEKETLCAFSEVKTSLIQRSAPTPPEGVTTTLVLVDKGENPASYEGLDVAGKIVLSRGSVAEIAKLAVDKFGASGIVVDTMREHPPVRDRFDLPNGRQYLSFWPPNPDTFKAFGFVISPRQGEALRRRCLGGRKELKVFARVDTRFQDGSMEVVSALIPGQTDEEVAAVAHLCHPEPSANDNASGSGTLMETVRTLTRLIKLGRLPKPKRTIRFLWVPEMTGSYAFLANHEDVLEKTVAAINLDMVGENQDLCGSTFNVERPVSALAGFGGDLAAAVLELLTKDLNNFGHTHGYSSFRWTVSPYSGGSDHNIWGDPTVGVTCPMLIQWPDKFYHTSEDTIDKVDPKMLGVAGALTATYLYTAARADAADAAYVAGQAAVSFASEVNGALSLLVEGVSREVARASNVEESRTIVAKARRAIERRAGFLSERRRADVESLLKLAPDSPMFSDARLSAKESIAKTGDFLMAKALRDLAVAGGYNDTTKLPPAWQPKGGDISKRASEIVPQRIFRGPFSGMAREASPDFEVKLKAFHEKHCGAPVPSANLEYWADGHRTLAEIADLVEGETGFCHMEALVEYYDLMVERGVFKGD